MSFFITDGGLRAMPRVHDGVLRQGQEAFPYATEEGRMVTPRQVRTAYAFPEEHVPAYDEALGGTVEADVARGVPRREKHL